MVAGWVTFFFDPWGLRWTRRRIGTAGAIAVASYRGWKWFGMKDKVWAWYDIARDVIVALMEEFGFDDAWRKWAWDYMMDKETWKGAAFSVFMLFLFCMFSFDGEISAEGLRRWICGDDDTGNGGGGNSAAIQEPLDDNRRLQTRLQRMEKERSEEQHRQNAGDCIIAGVDVSSNLDRLRERPNEHRMVALQDANVAPKKKDKEDGSDDFDSPENMEDVNKLTSRLEREMQNPSEKFLKSLRAYKVMDDWPMPAGARQRLGPTFLGETVYKGGNAAEQYWTDYMFHHGITDCPAARDGLTAAVAPDYVPLVDGGDIVNSTAAETLARELYGLTRCSENCRSKDDWRQPKGAKSWTSKAQWGLRERYSIRALMNQAARAPAADPEVRGTMETEALFPKYLTKSGTDGREPGLVLTDASDAGAATGGG